MKAESEEQRAIQSLIDQEDRALSQWDLDGMSANLASDYVDISRGRTSDIATVRGMWLKGLKWVDITSTSEITGFVLTGNKAGVRYTSQFWTRLKFPQWLSKILIITDELYRSEWVKTSEGWQCKTSEHLKTRFRSVKWQNTGKHLVSEPRQPAT